MHHHVQRGKVRSQVINVPEGFPELLSDISREVLRCQPSTECMCQFIIDYLHSIIVTRDKARVAKSIIDRALRTVDDIIGDMCVCDISKAKAEQMSEALDECFKRFLAKRRCEKGLEKEILRFRKDDMMDELIHKCKFSEDELKISRPIIEKYYQKFVDAYMLALENNDGTECMYQYFLDREIKRAEARLRADAAIKIQANFRGFMLRKTLLYDKMSIAPSRAPSKSSEEMENAARKIQKFYRQHVVSIQEKSVDETVEKDDTCAPTSNISLTARPAGHQNLEQDKKPPDVEHKDNIQHDEQPNPEEKVQIEEVHEAAVEEVKVEVFESNEETTVKVEVQETNEEIHEEVDVQQANEEIIVHDEPPTE